MCLCVCVSVCVCLYVCVCLQRVNSASTQHISASRHQNFMKIDTGTPRTFKDIFQSGSRAPAPVRNVQHPYNLQQCHPSLRVFLMPLNSTEFNHILNTGSSGPLHTLHNVIKDNSPSQEHQNHHQLQQQFGKCH